MASNRLLQADEVEGTLTGRNYITNGNAERNVIGMSAYADTAGAVPVDMTGGSPSATITRTTSSPLRGAGSFLITKGASNLQGNGVSTPFTIDTCDQAKILTFTFDYAVASGTFNFNGASYSSPSDLAVYVYDITNSVLIYPSNSWLDGSGKFIAQFQTSSNSTSYRVGLHIATTNASAWTFKFDNLKVGSVATYKGTVITDWVSYTPTFSGLGTVSNPNFKSRRVGDSLEIYGAGQFGTGTASQAQISIGYAGSNANVTIDTNKVPPGGGIIGEYTGSGSSTTFFGAVPLAPGSNQTYFNLGVQNSAAGGISIVNGNTTGLTGQFFAIHVTVPIVGWSSNINASSDYGNRVISLKATGTPPTGTVAASFNTTVFGTTTTDSVAGYNAATGVYTIKETGFYNVAAEIWLQGTLALNNAEIIRISWSAGNPIGVNQYRAGGAINTSRSLLVSGSQQLNAGDTVQIQVYSDASSAAYSSVSASSFTLSKVQSPQTLQGGTVVAFRGTNSALTSIGTSETTVPFTSTKDTHGTWNGTGYVVPVSGWYTISSRLLMTVNLSTSQNAYMGIFLDGVAQAYGPNCYGAGVSRAESPTVVGSIYANQGQVISIKSAAGVSTALISAGTNNYLSIVKEN